jgi:multidrug efflux pump subunit AcrB
MKLGIAGGLTRAFIASPLTPLLLLTALALGLLALLTLPREEEPQISVPMVDIHVSANGLKAEDAVKLVTEPLETIVKSIDGVEHVYSQTQDDGSVVTARFEVGTSADAAILRVHDKVRANMDRIPVGIQEPLIVGRGIDDVAIVVLTLSPTPAAASRWTSNDLTRLARELQVEISKLPDIGLTYIVGEQPEEIRIEPDPELLSLYGITLQQLSSKIEGANRSFQIGMVREGGEQRTVVAGQTLQTMPEIGNLLLTARDGRPVYVRDVAKVVLATEPNESRVTEVRKDEGALERVPAVSLAIAKRPGTNAVVIGENILLRVEQVRGQIFPEDVEMSVTRDYGETANEKANELLFHLGLATISIVILVAVAIGWREALVVAVVIPTTILLTLFAARIMGYTLNRVSLFALIFSIGILVDDAIVVIENISRHWAMRDGRSRAGAAIDAVAEVGNPTIVATLTVVAALLPMLFVSGMMGPYMSPIPANASAAMLFSFFVAVILTPWLMMKFGKKDAASHAHGDAHGGWLGRAYVAVARPLLKSKTRAWGFLAIIGIATIASLTLFYTKGVTVKLLPFDNKAELQVVVDLPEGASVEATDRALQAIVDRLAQVPEVVSFQTYAGTASPFNFNGLVRHYYLRDAPQLGDVQVNLLPKGERDRASHDIALDIRERLKGLAVPAGTVVKVVEPPPGPPVMGTLLAEIYGPDPETRRAVAAQVRKTFEGVPFIVDVDDSYGVPAERVRLAIDQDSLEYYRVEQSDLYDTLGALYGGVTVGYSHRGGGRQPIPIRIALAKSAKVVDERALATPVPANVLPGGRDVVELGLLPYLPAQWPPGGNDNRRARGRVRGSGLRHACGRRCDRQGGLGQCSEAGNRAARPTGRRIDADTLVGRRVGGHMGDVPRHGRGIHGRNPRHLRAGRGAVPLFQAAACHPDAHPAHLHRHHVRALAIWRAVHRHVDDRFHRARRHHRAQLDPARRFHPPYGATGPAVDRHPARSGSDPVQADPAHRNRRDDRCSRDSGGPHLPGAGDLAAVRACLLDRAHRAGHPGDLRGPAGWATRKRRTGAADKRASIRTRGAIRTRTSMTETTMS